MSIVIINRVPKKLADYKSWLFDSTEEIILLTKSELLEEFHSIPQVQGFSNFSKNENIYKYILNLETNISSIVSINEFDLIKAGMLRERLNLPGQNSESAKAFRNKVIMKDYVSRVIKVPKYKELFSVFDLLDFINLNGYPVVIKPIDGAASKDVSVIKNEEELERYLVNGKSENMMVEEFIQGEMYHVDGLFIGESILMSYPSKYIKDGCMAYKNNEFLGSFILSENNPLFVRLNEAVGKVINSLPTPNTITPFHAEIFHTENDELVFCEIASRVGGGKIVEAIEASTGINILKEWVRAQANLPASKSLENLEGHKNIGWLLFPPFNGKFQRLSSNLPGVEGIVELEVNAIEGNKYCSPSFSVDNVGGAVVEGVMESDVENKLFAIYDWYKKSFDYTE